MARAGGELHGLFPEQHLRRLELRDASAHALGAAPARALVVEGSHTTSSSNWPAWRRASGRRVGKTTLAQILAQDALQKGHSVRFSTLANTLADLARGLWHHRATK